MGQCWGKRSAIVRNSSYRTALPKSGARGYRTIGIIGATWRCPSVGARLTLASTV